MVHVLAYIIVKFVVNNLNERILNPKMLLFSKKMHTDVLFQFVMNDGGAAEVDCDKA